MNLFHLVQIGTTTLIYSFSCLKDLSPLPRGQHALGRQAEVFGLRQPEVELCD